MIFTSFWAIFFCVSAYTKFLLNFTYLNFMLLDNWCSLKVSEICVVTQLTWEQHEISKNSVIVSSTVFGLRLADSTAEAMCL